MTVSLRLVPHHLSGSVAEFLANKIKNGVEHPSNEPVPWVSCAVIVSKHDVFLRLILDARNLDEELISPTYPIPK